MTDEETLRVYAERAEEYAALPLADDMSKDLQAFIAALPDGDGPILDWGAGPGHDAARMVELGLACEATDAAPEMVALCAAKSVPSRCEPFEALEAAPRYRGIWANFSLLHADADALPGLIQRAGAALLLGGVLHIALKRGHGTKRDRLGRRYTYLEAEDLDRLTQAAGFTRLAVRHGETVGLDGAKAGFVVHLSQKTDA